MPDLHVRREFFVRIWEKKRNKQKQHFFGSLSWKKIKGCRLRRESRDSWDITFRRIKKDYFFNPSEPHLFFDVKSLTEIWMKRVNYLVFWMYSRPRSWEYSKKYTCVLFRRNGLGFFIPFGFSLHPLRPNQTQPIVNFFVFIFSKTPVNFIVRQVITDWIS